MKKLFEYLPFYFLLALISGIICQYYFAFKGISRAFFFCVYTVLGMSLFIAKKSKKDVLFTGILVAFFVCLGLHRVYVKTPQNNEHYFFKFNDSASFTTIKIIKVLKSTPYYKKYYAQVTSINHQSTSGIILLNIKKDSLDNPITVDSEIITTSNFTEIPPPLNPYQFNYQSYLQRQGVLYQMHLNPKNYILVSNKPHTLFGISENIRSSLQKKITMNFKSAEVISILNALLLGSRQNVSEELTTHYANAGAIHILAISGLHIGILLYLLNVILKPLHYIKHGKYISLLLSLCILWSFAFISGLSASVVRAATMFTFISIGEFLNRKAVIEHSIISSLLLLLLINPLFLFDVGFQLSYLAVLGIVWIYPIINSFWLPKNKFIRKYWQLLAISISAQLAIAPLSIFYFHQFPALFFLSNLVIIPFLGIILIIGFVLLLSFSLNFAPRFLIWSYEKTIYLMNSFIKWVASFDSFIFSEIPMPISKLLGWYCVIISAVYVLAKFSYRKLGYLLSSILVLQGIYFTNKFYSNKETGLIVFHKSKHSIVGIENNNKMNIYHALDSLSIHTNKLLVDYRSYKGTSMSYNSSFIHSFEINGKLICFITPDSVNMLTIIPKHCIIILMGSPKFNLKRVLLEKNPSLIIADGSNYKSYVELWRKTCKKQKTPFHSTLQNGAYILK